MKKVVFLASFVLLSISVFSQSTQEEVEYMEALFGMEKRAAIRGFIVLEGDEGERFWNLYDEYELTRREYGKQRIRLLESSVERFDTFSDEECDRWMKEVMDLRKKNEILIEKYYKKIRKGCSAPVAMQFYQVESYILAGIRFQILESLPF